MNKTGTNIKSGKALKASLVLNKWFMLLLCLGPSVTFHAKAQSVKNHVMDFAFINASNAPGLPWSAPLGFGHAITGIGDVNGDGVPDLAIGQPAGENGSGAVFVLLMNGGGYPNLLTYVKAVNIDTLAIADSTYAFGSALASLGDLDLDGVPDLAILSPGDDAGALDLGAIHILYLNTDGSVKTTAKISALHGGFTTSGSGDSRMTTIGAGGDLNGDGIPDLLIGAQDAADGVGGKGIVWGVLLNRNGTVLGQRNYSSASTWPSSNPISNSDSHFGRAVVGLDDIDGDGHADIAVSTESPAAVYLLALNDNGTIKTWRKVEPTDLTDYSTAGGFGFSLSSEYDLDANGVQDLLIGDPTHAENDVLCGAVVQLDPAPTTEALEYSMVTNGTSTNSSVLDLGDNARLGHSIAQWGDADNDGNAELVLGIPQPFDPNSPQQIVVAFMQAHPITFNFEIMDETPSSLGSVELHVSGGVPPYTYYWSKELADTLEFDSSLAKIDVEGLELIGMLPPIHSTFTPAELAALVEPVLTAVKAGMYWVQVDDAKGHKHDENFAVGLEILTLVEEGANTSGDNKEVTKTTENGWANMQLSTKNVLPSKEDGWVRFQVPTSDKMLAVGFRNLDTAPTSGYDYLDQAFYFDQGKVYFWDGTTLIDSSISITADDKFQLERKDNEVLFYVNDTVTYAIKPIAEDRTLTISVAIYDQGGTVSSITTNFRTSFGLNPSVGHLDPLTPNSGSIALALHSGLGPYTCVWSSTSNTDPALSDVPAGEHAVTVTSANFDQAQYRSFTVGSKLIWEPSLLTEEAGGLGIKVTKPGTIQYGWNQILLSKNMVRQGAGHSIAFKAYPADMEHFGTLVGLRSGSDNKLWAGWWVYSFGENLIAQTFSRSGAMVRTLVKPTDELEIFLHTYSIHFLKNGELVQQIPRTVEAESFLVAALHSDKSVLKDLHSTITVPLVLNTSMLEHDMPYVTATPEGVTNAAITGADRPFELGALLPTGLYTINGDASGSPAANWLNFDLENGGPATLKFNMNGVPVLLDSSLFEFRAPNTLILYDEPETLMPELKVPFHLSLLDQLVMTPDGDGQFDTFQVVGTVDPDTYQLTITDLQENLLFQTADVAQVWNGKFMNTGTPVPPGIYNYSIEQPGGPIKGQFMVKL